MRVDSPTGEAPGRGRRRDHSCSPAVGAGGRGWMAGGPHPGGLASEYGQSSFPYTQVKSAQVISTDPGCMLLSQSPTALSPRRRPPSPGPGGSSLAAVPLVSPLSAKSSEPQYTVISLPPSFPGVAERNKIKYVNPSLPVWPILRV